MKIAPKSILSISLRSKLGLLGLKLEKQLPIDTEFDGIFEEINSISPSYVSRADREIPLFGNLQKWRREFPAVIRLFSPRVIDLDQLDLVPNLEFLFIFHKDGFIREAALDRIETAIPSPFLFAAIAWRLNDWIPPVRRAAVKCASRCFPSTSPVVIAEAALSLLAREDSWGRWSDERSALSAAFARADVAEVMATAIRARPTGPMATVLRYALREYSLDPHLESLALAATQPAVRATAMQALIDGQATWPSGWRWRWIDKPMGKKRRETTFSHRPIAHGASRIRLIEASSVDPSAIVRRVAIASLIRHPIEPAVAHRIAIALLKDRSPSVREQAEFLLTERHGAAP
jgi:hypothetical protein